ncbi:hypothetical protein BTN50_0112 [Candidatus Enterovibrio altilux]|uniref:Mobile element protein n=1 Tax=Candidatus Enterovibrio altilux TaxID=1927128 RepID=A0A291B6P5_9GAMM|nr:hypothetical protein BTN50_0112 [Candidatus Enterovibrio luxaltus]
MTDDEVLPNLLKQTRQKINGILADGVYDTKQCYEIVRIKRVVPLIPPKKGIIF